MSDKMRLEGLTHTVKSVQHLGIHVEFTTDDLGALYEELKFAQGKRGQNHTKT